MMQGTRGVRASALLAVALATALGATGAHAQITDENPPVMLQWFECRWPDMERRMADWFVAGYGATWLPPVSRGRATPNQNSTSAGYDVFDRFALGKPGEETAYGTEKYFAATVEEFHRANGQVFVDMVLNHNAQRDTSVSFQQEGGYPGFWMSPQNPMRAKLPTDNWGDFHGGISSGYYQSENPNGARYCLLNGDLVALVDIDHASNNFFIRQPTAAGNPQNIPAGTVYNRPDPANARFYPDSALGTDVVNNPGMSYAGPLNTGIFSAPCDIPARDEPSSVYTAGRFNLANPMAGDPVAENATGYLLRWTQWMMDVHGVDGFRIDAIKHMPSWFYDTYYDSVVAGRRVTPDGRRVTPYSFGECVEGNDFTFDRYIRKPNGRGSGRSVAGDAFGNRDALDLNGAGGVRDLINGFTDWNGMLGRHLDGTDDGFQNGSIGVNHIYSHDNGSSGDGSSLPAVPGYQQQGWFAHCYLVMRPGQAKIYHNARGVNRTGSGFYPREGEPLALGWDPSAASLNPVLTNLVQLSNWYGRGWYYPKWTDNEVHIFERATPLGTGLSGNVLVACNRSYAGTGITSYDQRTFNTSFPQGTRLIEMTGNAANASVDPLGQISEVLVVGAGGSVTVRVPRNQNINGVTHHRGFVVYGPAVPSGTVTITGTTGTLGADNPATPDARQRLAALPIVTAPTFQIQLTTTNGDSGAGSNANADDNALFRIDQGFVDYNGSGAVDVDYTSSVAPGYEGFVTLRQPLAGTTNTNGQYAQQITTSLLDEGTHYLSVVAFRKRATGEAPLFREFRQAFYVDLLPPSAQMEIPETIPTTTQSFRINALDRTVNRVHVVLNPPNVADPLTLATVLNQAAREDRRSWTRVVTGLQPGWNRLLVCAFEESGRGAATFYDVFQGVCPADWNHDDAVDGDDVIAFFSEWDAGDADFNGDGGTDGDDVIDFFFHWDANC